MALVDAQVTNTRELIKSAKDFAATARKVCPGINIIFIKKSEVEHHTHLLNQVAFSGVRTLNGIRKVHHMEVSNFASSGLLHFFKFLLITFSFRLNQISKLNSITSGSWCQQGEGVWLPGGL